MWFECKEYNSPVTHLWNIIVQLLFVFQDLRNQLYESYYLNFISAISRSKLEDIASAALGANAVTQVTKVRCWTFLVYQMYSKWNLLLILYLIALHSFSLQVFDQYLNFITLEDDMFVLCNQNKELISYHGMFLYKNAVLPIH